MRRSLLVLMMFALAACGDVDDDEAKVRIVNALSAYDTLDLLVGDQTKVQDLPYGQRSVAVQIGVRDRENEDPDLEAATALAVADSTTSTESSTTTNTGGSSTTTTTTTTTIPTGTRTLQVFVDSVATRLIEQAVTLVAQRRYTFYAYEDGTGARLVVLQESSQDFVGGKLKLRVADMAPSSGVVDVYVLQQGQTIAGQTPVASSLAPTTLTEYLDVDPGTYQVVLAQTGTTTVVFDSGPVALAKGTAVTMIVLDNKGGGLPLGYLLATD